MILNKKLYEPHNFFKALYLIAKTIIKNILRYCGRKKTPFSAKQARSDRFRGLPYLTLKENGTLQCTSCRLCESYCPPRCIHIESKYGTNPKSSHDQGPPSLFRIEILHCTFCGFCVEACPVDAIRMSSEDCLSDHAGKNWSLDQKTLAFRSSLNDSKGILSRVQKRS